MNTSERRAKLAARLEKARQEPGHLERCLEGIKKQDAIVASMIETVK